MNLTEIKFTLEDIVLNTSKMLKTPSPKIVYGFFDNDVSFDDGVNEIYINERVLYNLNNLTSILFELFKCVRLNYQAKVITAFSFLENEETIKIWKNEQFKRLMLEENELIILNTQIDAVAFSILMIKKFFNIDMFMIKDFDDNVKNKFIMLKQKYN